MIIHTMTVPQMVAEARKDMAAMRNKLDKPLRELRREHIKRKEGILCLLPPWTSPNKNNWLLLVHYDGSGPRVYSMAWYLDRDGRINAVLASTKGLAYHIDRHVIERYGERFDPTAAPLERLRGFFLENHFYSCEPTTPEGEGRWKVNVGMNQGMGLGVWDEAASVVYVRTFVNHGQLFKAQADAMERMDIERVLYAMTPGLRRHFIDLYKRKFPQDAGSPGMAWLEQFAA